MCIIRLLFVAWIDIVHTAYLCDRSEASTIPTLLVAPPQAPKNNDSDSDSDRSIYGNNVGDHRAIYQDGTWVAVDHDTTGGYYEEEWYDDEEDMDPQDAYYKSLLVRYDTLRKTLATADPQELAALVKANPQKYANVRLPYYKSDWRYAFDNKFPTPALVAQIDDKTLYRALEYLAEVLAVNETISKQKSTWAWTLLALVGERGTLDFYREGRVRELGHKAGQLSIRLRNGEYHRAYEREEDSDEESGIDGEDQDNELSWLGDDEDDRDSLIDVGDQWDSSTEPKPTEPGPPADEMAISEDEGEVKEDTLEDEEEPSALEAARARLLAQLGDNLVKESIPDRKVPAHQLKGKRHRHNGKVCRDPACRVHRKANLQAAQDEKHKVATASSPTKPSKKAQLPANVQQQDTNPKSSSAGEGNATVQEELKGREEKQSHQATASSMQQVDASASPEPTDSRSAPCDSKLSKEEGVLNTKVAVDMILTVVGDRYGQRDLLRFREAW